MCVPEAPDPAPVAATTPSMTAASALQLGGAGAPRGAAGLARQKLRNGASSSSAVPASMALGDAPTAPDAADSTPVPNRSLGTFSVNPALRLGAS